MRPTAWSTLLVVAGVTMAVTWTVLRMVEGSGYTLPEVPLLVSGVLVAIAAVVLWLGLTVRQFLRGKRPDLSGLRAARTAVLAKASCYTGALLVGWYGAQVLLVLGDLAIEARRDRAIAAGVATLCSLLLAVVGLVVERFCRLPPPEDGEVDDPGAAPSGTTV